MELKELTLQTVAAGAAGELFQHELRRVLENIKDPNTEADAKRTIMLAIVFVPHDGPRNEAAVSVQVTSKLAPIIPASGFAFIGRQGGELVAYTHDVAQGALELETVDKSTGEIIDMKGRTRGA